MAPPPEAKPVGRPRLHPAPDGYYDADEVAARRAYMVRYKAENAEALKAYYVAWRAAHPEKHRAYSREWAARDRAKRANQEAKVQAPLEAPLLPEPQPFAGSECALE